MKRTCHRKQKVTVKGMLLVAVALGFCLALSIFAPTTASADWGFRMNEDQYGFGGGNFAKIEFFIPDVLQNAGITWSGTGVSNFDNAGWNAQQINPTYVLATGPKTTGNMFWDVLFTGAAPTEFRLDYLGYKDNGNMSYGTTLTIKNGVVTNWAQLNLNNLPNYGRTPVVTPVPPTVFLLGAGLIGMAVLRKRVRSKDITS